MKAGGIRLAPGGHPLPHANVISFADGQQKTPGLKTALGFLNVPEAANPRGAEDSSYFRGRLAQLVFGVTGDVPVVFEWKLRGSPKRVKIDYHPTQAALLPEQLR